MALCQQDLIDVVLYERCEVAICICKPSEQAVGAFQRGPLSRGDEGLTNIDQDDQNAAGEEKRVQHAIQARLGAVKHFHPGVAPEPRGVGRRKQRVGLCSV